MALIDRPFLNLADMIRVVPDLIRLQSYRSVYGYVSNADVAEHWIDPRHFVDTFNSYLGSAFSIQPTLTQSAWFRPHNRSEDVDNLYFVGAGTHPGAGVPGVVSSAKIVDNLIGDPAAAAARAPSPTASVATTRTVPSAPSESPTAGG